MATIEQRMRDDSNVSVLGPVPIRRHPWLTLTHPRTGLIAIMLLAFVLIGAGLGLREPSNVDEERFLGVALEMLQNGSWIIPHRAGQIYPDKPPLFMWIVAFLIRVTGSPKLALFLPAVIAGTVATGCLYDLGRRWWNRRIGVIAALLFLACFQTYNVLRAGQLDGLLCLWMALGTYGLLRHLIQGPAWGWFYVACAAMGFGVITKVIGFLPLFMLLPYAYAVRKGWKGVGPVPGEPLRWALGGVVMIAAVAVWAVPLAATVLLHGDPESLAYLQDVTLRQTAERYTNAWMHREPVWFYFTNVIPEAWTPIIFGLPWLVPAWRRQLLKKDGRLLVLLGWAVMIVLFFSLSTGKRKLYIFPALLGIVLAVAPLVPWLLQRWFDGRPRLRRIFTGVAVVWFAAWFVAGFVEPIKDGPNPHAGVMRQTAKLTGGAELLLIEWREGHWLYARQPIVHFGFQSRAGVDEAAQWLRAHPQAFALVPARELSQCFVPEKARKVGDTSRAEWFVVGPDADNGRCRTELPSKEFRFAWRTPL
ncbi:glycosyltransferase family 39 protein [Aromatoleum toluclasticum]|uniref:ArnT family glycosyltransferase n=1 Tax=Aromatoleum toluclasticum TaxID=92003 RepID=UPI001D18914E|nr:glycosyltransferase family 39 protein [Aromatoleum toluclasticum]MCC4115180.1 glycosyltransferase family 39 protein [Aromatoleum toluclasticum]